MRRKNDALTQAFEEKNRKLLQTQELYNKLKRKAVLGQVQDSAFDDVDSALHTVSRNLQVGQPQGVGNSVQQYHQHGIPFEQRNSGSSAEDSSGSGLFTRLARRISNNWDGPAGLQGRILQIIWQVFGLTKR